MSRQELEYPLTVWVHDDLYNLTAYLGFDKWQALTEDADWTTVSISPLDVIKQLAHHEALEAEKRYKLRRKMQEGGDK